MAAMMLQETVKKYFRGFQHRKFHESKALGCKMSLGVYLPGAYETESKIPVLYYLSGLTCTDENASQKSGIQQYADEKGIAVVFPDTSPRGLNVPGESDSWDFGVGAGFYLNATMPKWKKWRMYDYITEELPSYLQTTFPNLDTTNASLTGHSMGGHGALTIFFKNHQKYKSVSAFSPICNPVNCPWGKKAFTGYLGKAGGRKRHANCRLSPSFLPSASLWNYDGSNRSIVCTASDSQIHRWKRRTHRTNKNPHSIPPLCWMCPF